MLNIPYKTMTESHLQTASICSIGDRYYISYITDKGISKEENQDNLLVRHEETSLGYCALLVVADGVGGLQQGAAASKTAVDKLKEWWDFTLKTLAFHEVSNVRYLINESLNASVSNINNKIYKEGSRCGIKSGTTLSVLFIMDDWYSIKHVGDSRIYKLDRNFVQITEDDSLLKQYIKTGRGNEIGKDYHKLANTITKCLGIKPDIEMFEQNGTAGQNDSFMLCTDGFYKRVSLIELYRCLLDCSADNKSSQSALRQIYNKARARGEQDDITSIVAVPCKENKGFWQRIIKLGKG